MITVFLKVISDILQQHENMLRKYKKTALKLKDYDGIFLKARTTNGRTYFTGHRTGSKPKYIGNEQHTTVQRIQRLRATRVLISLLESNIAVLKHFQDNYIDITTAHWSGGRGARRRRNKGWRAVRHHVPGPGRHFETADPVFR